MESKKHMKTHIASKTGIRMIESKKKARQPCGMHTAVGRIPYCFSNFSIERAVSFIYPISAVQSMLNGMTRIKAGIRSTSGTDLIRETRKPAAIVNELMNLVKRVGTVRPSLFLPKFPSLFLAHCRK